MRAKEYLERIKIKREIFKQTVEEYKEFVATQEGVRAIMYGDKVQSTTEGDLSDTVARKEELLNKVKSKKEDYENYREEVVDNIHKLSNGAYLNVLYGRYLKELTYKELSRDIGYSPSHLKKLHREACTELENKVLNNTN